MKCALKYSAPLMFVMLLVNRPVFAQSVTTEIEGKLRWPSGESCGYCRIRLEAIDGATAITSTNAAGEFHFRGLKPGLYTIQLRLPGTENADHFVMAGGLTRITIDLQPQADEAGQRLNPATLHRSELAGSYPKQAVDLFEAGFADIRKENARGAAAYFEEALLLAPDFYAAHQELGRAYQSLGRLGDAEREFRTAARINPSSPDPLIYLGEVHILRREWGLAAQVSVEALERDTRAAPAFLNLGIALYCDAKLDLAQRAFVQGLHLEPGLDQARLMLINLYLQTKNWDKAREHIDRYLEKARPNAEQTRLKTLSARLRRGDRPQEATQTSPCLR
jgi:Tfp pilus assembly protein PilF